MRAVYQARDAIYAILSEAKTPGAHDFPIRSTTNLYDFQPSDFTFDGVAARDGVYIYFEKTRLDESDASTDTQSHRPRIHFDMYVSMPASRDTGTGAIDFAVRRANKAVEALDVEIYEALSSAAFRRLIQEKLGLGADWVPSAVHVSEVENIGVLKTPKTQKALAVHRIVLLIEVCENHIMNPGVVYDGTDDFVEPFRISD